MVFSTAGHGSTSAPVRRLQHISQGGRQCGGGERPGEHTIRTEVEGQPVATSTLAVNGLFTLEQLEGDGMNAVRDRIVEAIIGKS